MTSYSAPTEHRDGKATASLVLGIVSIFINPLFIPSIIAIVLGFIARRPVPGRTLASDRTKALVGLILGFVGTVTAIITIVVFTSLSSAITNAANNVDPSTGTIKGTVTISGETCLAMSDDGYSDITDGAEVDVVSTSGKVLGVGALGTGVSRNAGCVFPYKVTAVPRGEHIYGVQIGSKGTRGVVHYNESVAFTKPADIVIGS